MQTDPLPGSLRAQAGKERKPADQPAPFAVNSCSNPVAAQRTIKLNTNCPQHCGMAG